MSWVGYASKRLVVSVGILLGASVVIFSMLRLIPGDPALLALGPASPEGALEAMRHRLGLDQPAWQQYFIWLKDVAVGNWGESLVNGKPVKQTILDRYPRSLQLALMAMLISIIISLPLGILGGVRRNSLMDYVALFFSQVGVSLPSFWFGLILILIFGKFLNVLPPSGYVPLTEDIVGNLKHTIMPATALGLINAAVITRFVRAELLEEINKDYVRTAKAFGHPKRRIIGKYVLRNSLIPAITVIGIQVGYMIGGVVIIEQVFVYPGIGNLILTGILNRDYPVIQLGLLVLAATFILINLIVDLLYGFLDPKVRY